MATKDKKKTEAKEKKPIASKENEALDSSESTDSLESSEDRVIALSDIVSKTSQFSNRLVMISSGISERRIGYGLQLEAGTLERG